MATSLQRLLVLRERLKKLAEAQLQTAHAQQAREQEASCDYGSTQTPTEAQQLQWAQEARDAARSRATMWDEEVARRSLGLNDAKRALRQVEKLEQHKSDEAQQKELRRALREQEDWVRSRAHKEL